MRHKLAASFIIMIFAVFLVGQTPYQTQAAKFVVSSHTWSYPDEYGQGIEYAYFVCSLDETPYNWTYQYFNGTEDNPQGQPAGLEVMPGASVGIRVRVWLNGTQTGYSYVEGRDQFTRVGIVVSLLGEVVFSQENLTQDGGSLDNDPMWILYYYIYLNGDPLYLGPDFQANLIYTVGITYEIYH